MANVETVTSVYLDRFVPTTNLQTPLWARNSTEPSYAVFRLSGAGDLGCSSSCDSSCSMKRVFAGVEMTGASKRPAAAAPKPSRYMGAECDANTGSIKLTPTVDRHGNIIPDFSTVGFKPGEVPLPTAPVALQLAADPASGGDDLSRVQAAIGQICSSFP